MSNWWEAGLGTDQLQRDSERAKQLLNGIGDKAVSESSRIGDSFDRIGKYAAGYFTIQGAAGLVKEVANVRGEFQKLEVGFTTMLGSKDKSATLMAQMVDTAAKTPFTLEQVAGGAKQLLAYQVAQEDVNGTLIRLGNISAGLGVPLERLIMVYGQVKAKGKLMGDDLRQFTEAGVPMIHELAKQMGVADGEVQKLISSGKIGFPQVQKVIENLTGAGGMFYNLMEEQSKTITGQTSNLEDALTRMFNSIGEGNQGLISGALSGITSLVDNYQEVGKAIAELIAIYGTYKAVLITLNTIHAVQEAMAVQRALAINAETGERIALSTAEAFGAVVETRLSAAQLALNNSIMANPYVLAAVAVTTLAYGIYKLATYTTDAEKAHNKLMKTVDETNNSIASEQVQIDTMFARLKSAKKGTEEYQAAKDAIQSKYGEYLKNLGDEKTALNNVALAYNAISQGALKAARARGLEAATKTAADDLINKQKETKEKIKDLLDEVYGKDSKQSIEYQIKLKPIIEKGGDNRAISNEFIKQLQDKSTGIYNYSQKLQSILIENGESKKIYDKIINDASKNFGEAPKKTETKKEEVKAAVASTDQELATARKIANEKKKLNEEIAKDKLTADRKIKDEEFSNRQSAIDMAKDSYTKELAQLSLNHEKKLEEIKRAKEDELKIEQDKQEKIWELSAQRDKKGNVIGTFNKSNVKLPESTLKVFDTATNNENNSFSNATTDLNKKMLEELLTQYKSYQQKRDDLNSEYATKESSLYESMTDDNKDKVEAALSVLSQNHKDALLQINNDESDSISRTSDLFIRLFGDASKKSVAEIRKVATETKALYDYLKQTPENKLSDSFGFTKEQLASMKGNKALMKDMENQITSLNDTANKGDNLFGDFGVNIKKIFDGFGKGKKSVGDFQKGMEGLQAAFQGVSSFASQATGLLNAMSTEEGDAASSAAKSIGAVMDVANSTMQGFQQGGVVGGAVAFTMSVATKIFEAEKAHQAALKKLRDEKNAQQKEYNDLLIKQNELLENAVNIFGTDTFAQAIGYSQVADKYRAASKNANVDLSNATVQTGSHKTGLFGWGGEKADYSSLLGEYPELIDAQGTLNQELAQSILDNQTLNDESKKALQSALDYSKDYEDALKSLSDYLTTVFGSLGSDMMTAITDNLGDTKSALDDFAGSASKTIEKLMTDIAYSMFMADKFTKLSNDVKAVISNNTLTPEQQAAQETELLGSFYANIGSSIDSANKFLQSSKDAAAKAGFDLWNETTRESSSKGFSSMSQDSADELNGRFTAMQGHTASIVESMKSLQENSAQALKHLAGIETNTARLEAVENGIVSVNKSMDSVKQGIETINLKGVKLQ